MQPPVSIGIVLFGTDLLRESLPTLLKQDYPNIEFLFRDHSPGGAAAKFIREELPEVAGKAKLEVGENLFHSGGMNALVRKSSGDYFIAASPDALYPPDFVSKAILDLEKSEQARFGSATVKLRRWIPAKNAQTEILDSCGIGISKSHRFFDRGQGELDRRQYDNQREIFGASGALMILRRQALEEVKVGVEYFDERLHYKNDVDLAYRLQWLGWKCLFLPQITVFHARGLGSSEPYRKRSDFQKENSTFGQFTVVQKNFSEDFSGKVKFLTKLRLAALKVFSLLFERASWKGFRRFRQIQAELRKSSRRVSAQEIEKMMNS
ncbi:MAG: glycosyltransferase [Patescibacteria group bacterium]